MPGKSIYLANKLAELLRSGNWPLGGRLPPVRDLARDWDTSLVTMVKVLHMLVDRGLIEQAPGRGGYFLPGETRSSLPRALDSVPRARPDAIAATLREEILSGEYGGEQPLPQLKYLRGRFGCSHATIKTALELLVQERVLTREGSRFRLRRMGAGERAGSHVYVCGYPQMVEHHFDDVYTLIHAIETAVNRLNWGALRFFLAGSNVEHVRMLAELPDIAPPDHQVAGYILIRYLYRGGWKRFLLSRRRIPLVIVDFDQMADFMSSSDPMVNDIYYAQHHRNCSIVVPDNRIAGREVGNHLASLGHRRIAFFSHAPLDDPRRTNQAWARLRYEGIASVFPPAGQGERRMQVYDGSERMMGWLLKYRIQLAEYRVLDSLDGAPEAMVEEGNAAIDQARYASELARTMTPLFSEALRERDITAWVCAGDILAGVAHAFLRTHGIAVPDRITLVSFDNTRLSYQAGITSYDFGYERIGSLAVSHLAYPRHRPKPDSPLVHVAGQLVVRESSGNCRLQIDD